MSLSQLVQELRESARVSSIIMGVKIPFSWTANLRENAPGVNHGTRSVGTITPAFGAFSTRPSSQERRGRRERR